MADTTHVGVWSVLEVGVGIIVACCPALRVLLRSAQGEGSLTGPRTPRGGGGQVSERSAASRGLASRSSRGILGLRELAEAEDEDDPDGLHVNSSRVTPDEKLAVGERRGTPSVEDVRGDISLETIAFRHCENRPRWG
jgi:hypothetical protein